MKLFDYHFNKKEDIIKKLSQFLQKHKNAVVVAVISILFLSLLLIESTITGHVTRINSLEIELNETVILLKETKLKEQDCLNKIASCATSLEDYKNRYANLQNDFDVCNNKKSVCSSELTVAKGRTEDLDKNLKECYNNLTTAESTFKNIIEKSANYICCRPGIKTAFWIISNNEIICSDSGNRIDC